MEIIRGIAVRIEEREVLRLQGYKARGPRPGIRQVVAWGIEEGRSLIEPRAVYTQVAVEGLRAGAMALEGGLTIRPGSALSAWQGAQLLGVAICTIGFELEERVSQLFEAGEYPAALALDCVGSVAADSVADHVNYLVCQRAAEMGIAVGPRSSPGYGRWDVSEQQVLFSLLSGEAIGVCLNEHSSMIPRKSVSFCVGMGAGIVGVGRTNPCRHCNMKGCAYRRTVH